MTRRRRRAALIAALIGIALALGLATVLTTNVLPHPPSQGLSERSDAAPDAAPDRTPRTPGHEKPWHTARRLTGSVSDGTISEQVVTVPPGTERLGVSLRWHAADAKGENYLALELVAPDGVATYIPDFSRADRNWDLTVQRPASGDWTVRVIGSSVTGEQEYTVAIGLPAALTDGLVLHWKFDEDSGSDAVDSSGTGNDGTLHGPTRTDEGKLDRALHFDGADDYVNAPDDNTLDITGAISLAAWIKLDTLDNGQAERQRQMIVCKYAADIFKRGYQFGFNSVGPDNWAPHKLFFTVSPTADPFTGGVYVCDTVLEVDTWYHVCAILVPSSDTKIYINGAEHAGHFAYGSQSSGINVNDLPIQVGTGFDDDSPFEGTIDDVRVYNRALTPAEVSDLATVRKHSGGGGGGCSLAGGGTDPLAWLLPYLAIAGAWVLARVRKGRAGRAADHGSP